MSPLRPTVRDLVKEALAKPIDANGEPVWGVAGYCGNQDCETRWHQELVSTLAALKPVPTRLRCPSCHRWLSPRDHAPYGLREHWPVTGEDSECPFHRYANPPPWARGLALRPPKTFAEFVRTRLKKKSRTPRYRGKRLTFRGTAR